MPYRDTLSSYEASSGPILTWEFPYARLEDATPTLHKPAAVLGNLLGQQLTGTLISLDAANSIAVINIAPGVVYYHQVRNVLTYAAAVEATWTTLDVGTPLYYDRSATMPAGVYLSASPADNTGQANPFFGYVVLAQNEIPDGFTSNANPYPAGSAIAGVTHTDIAVMQMPDAY